MHRPTTKSTNPWGPSSTSTTSTSTTTTTSTTTKPTTTIGGTSISILPAPPASPLIINDIRLAAEAKPAQPNVAANQKKSTPKTKTVEEQLPDLSTTSPPPPVPHDVLLSQLEMVAASITGVAESLQQRPQQVTVVQAPQGGGGKSGSINITAKSTSLSTSSTSSSSTSQQQQQQHQLASQLLCAAAVLTGGLRPSFLREFRASSSAYLDATQCRSVASELTTVCTELRSQLITSMEQVQTLQRSVRQAEEREAELKASVLAMKSVSRIDAAVGTTQDGQDEEKMEMLKTKQGDDNKLHPPLSPTTRTLTAERDSLLLQMSIRDRDVASQKAEIEFWRSKCERQERLLNGLEGVITAQNDAIAEISATQHHQHHQHRRGGVGGYPQAKLRNNSKEKNASSSSSMTRGGGGGGGGGGGPTTFNVVKQLTPTILHEEEEEEDDSAADISATSADDNTDHSQQYNNADTDVEGMKDTQEASHDHSFDDGTEQEGHEEEEREDLIDEDTHEAHRHHTDAVENEKNHYDDDDEYDDDDDDAREYQYDQEHPDTSAESRASEEANKKKKNQPFFPRQQQSSSPDDSAGGEGGKIGGDQRFINSANYSRTPPGLPRPPPRSSSSSSSSSPVMIPLPPLPSTSLDQREEGDEEKEVVLREKVGNNEEEEEDEFAYETREVPVIATSTRTQLLEAQLDHILTFPPPPPHHHHHEVEKQIASLTSKEKSFDIQDDDLSYEKIAALLDDTDIPPLHPG